MNRTFSILGLTTLLACTAEPISQPAQRQSGTTCLDVLAIPGEYNVHFTSEDALQNGHLKLFLNDQKTGVAIQYLDGNVQRCVSANDVDSEEYRPGAYVDIAVGTDTTGRLGIRFSSIYTVPRKLL